MKKKVEITIDGEIAERIYKGEHNHSKPHTVMSTRQDAHVQIPASDAVKNQSCGETEMPNCNTVSSAVPPANDARTATTYTAGVPTSNNSFCASDDHVGVKDTVEAEDGDFIRKRRLEITNWNELGVYLFAQNVIFTWKLSLIADLKPRSAVLCEFTLISTFWCTFYLTFQRGCGGKFLC